MTKKYLKIIILFFALCTVFIFAKEAKAGFTDDNFSGYSSGQSVDTLGRWISPSGLASMAETFITNSANCLSGNCADMKQTGVNGRDFYNTATTVIPAFGNFDAYSQQVNKFGTDLYIRFYNSASTSLGIFNIFEWDDPISNNVYAEWHGAGSDPVGAWVGFTASSTWFNFSYNYNEATNEIRFRVNEQDWSEWILLADVPSRIDFRSQSVSPDGNRYIDNINFESIANDYANVEVIDVPNTLNNIYVSSEDFTYDSIVNCVIGQDCFVKYKYPIHFIDKILYLHPLTADGLEESDDYKILENQNYLRGELELAPQTATTSISYCITVVSAGEAEKKFCGISVFWDSTLNGELGYFDPYDITQACNEVATSSGTMWDDFRYGIECGFNKSMYWLFHPSDNAMEGLIEAKNEISNEFPINVYKIVFSKMANATSTLATSTEIKLYAGELSGESGGMLTIGTINEIKNLMSTAWDKIYLLLTFLILGFTFLFYVHWFTARN